MSASHRNRRLAVYAPAVTLDGGITTRTYTRLATWWARLEPPTGREATVGMAPAHRVDAVALFADEAVIDTDDVIVDEDDQVWEVRAVLPRVARAEIQCLLERGDQSVNTYLLLES